MSDFNADFNADFAGGGGGGVTDTDWPAALPQVFLMNGYKQVRPNTVIRSRTEVGPPIVRRRISAAVMPFSGTMMMTASQMAILDTFFDETLLGGALDFTFPAQDGSSDIWDVRFTAEPEETPVSDTHWQVSLALERLP